MEYRDPSDIYAELAVKPGFPGAAATADRLPRMKPQNPLFNLRPARRA